MATNESTEADDNVGAQAEDNVKSVLNDFKRVNLGQEVRRRPDRTQVTAGEDIGLIRGRLEKLLGDHINLTKVNVLPRMNSGKIKVTNAKERGRGDINELMVRLLFDEDQLYDAGSGYFVVHNHHFDPRLHCGFSREQDFILLHPTRGLIFAEVKGFLDHENITGFKTVFKKCKDQCSEGFRCMETCVKRLLKLIDAEGFETEVKEKVKQLFQSFTRLLLFPSLSNKILENPEAKALVDGLDENVKIFFKEDREEPFKMRSVIEENCFVNIPDELKDTYRSVYEIALSCCVFLYETTVRMNFTPSERSDTRDEHLSSMENIYLDYQQKLILKSQEKILFVEGVAGSGKTLICLAKMFDIAQNHPNDYILYLCCNRRLADRVRSLVEERKGGETDESRMQCYDHVEVYDVRTWVCANYPYLRSPAALWLEKQEGQATETTLTLQEKFKHVFIDEYQDMFRHAPKWFQNTFMSRLQGDTSTTGTFWVFYDNDQAVVINPRYHVEVPGNVSTSYLRTVYRSPYFLTQCFMRYALTHTSIHLGNEYLGMPVKIYHGDTEEERIQILSQTIENLKKDHSLRDDEITALKYLRGWNQERFDFLRCNRSTVQNIKGLESKVIIYFDPPYYPEGTLYPNIEYHYIPCSRALWMYIVIVSSPEQKHSLEREFDLGAVNYIGPERSGQMIRENAKKRRIQETNEK